jgi:hypothetical protein
MPEFDPVTWSASVLASRMVLLATDFTERFGRKLLWVVDKRHFRL